MTRLKAIDWALMATAMMNQIGMWFFAHHE